MRKTLFVSIAGILLLSIFSGIVVAADTSTVADTHFIFVIDNNRITSINANMVISGKNVIIVEDYLIVNVNYTSANGTVIQSGKVSGEVIKLPMVDGAHLILTDKTNNVILDTTLHSMNIVNFFTYVFPLTYQQIIITVLFAFIGSIFLVVAFYINKETKIL